MFSNKDTDILVELEKNKVGSSGEDEIAGFFVFSHIRMRSYFRLG